jgi:hypothetical protein
VQSDLSSLLTKGADNHLFWQSDLISGIMQFQRPQGFEIVSVSTDGKELPQIYAYGDIALLANSSSFQPSPIKMINGEQVESYLAKVAAQVSLHDADARYNALFPNQATISEGANNVGIFRVGQYDGSNTTFGFANGTFRTEQNVAFIKVDFTGVVDGKTLFSKFCSGPEAMSDGDDNMTSAASITNFTDQVGYPNPVIIHPQRAMGGYYLNDTGYEVGVLSFVIYISDSSYPQNQPVASAVSYRESL